MVINPIVGVYIPIIRIPIKRWDDHPQKNATFDHGTYGSKIPPNCEASKANKWKAWDMCAIDPHSPGVIVLYLSKEPS